MSRTLVIAEPGCTAEGDYATMVRLLEAAHACGADVWKPQWTSNPERMCERRKAPEYLRFYRWLQWPVAWHEDFANRCKALGMQYACSVYLPEDVATVAPWVDYLKISSFEASDPEILGAVYGIGAEVIVSLGMGAHCRLPPSVRSLALHCVSAYPTPLDEVNLGRIRRDGHRGLSDHTRHVWMGHNAVLAGAKVIEAHYRLDDCDPQNPDYAVAFSPAEFSTYIENIRTAETLMGDGIKRIQPCEEPMLRYRVTG